MNDVRSYTLQWADHPCMQVTSAEGLREILETIRTEHNAAEGVLVTLVRGNLDSMSIGLGQRLSVLTYVKQDGQASFTSKGYEAGGAPLVFMMGSHWSEYEPERGIPYEQARAAMEFYYETGQLSEAVLWEHD